MVWKDDPNVKALIQQTADEEGITYAEAEEVVESVFSSTNNAMKANFEKVMIWKLGSFVNKSYKKKR